MSSITKRQQVTGAVYRARVRDPDGREHVRHFKRRADAKAWVDEQQAAVTTGRWIDPAAGQVTFKEYAERWRARQMHRPSSAKHVEGHLRVNAYPVLGGMPLSEVRPSMVQAWVKELSGRLAPSTVRVVHGIVAAIFKDAVADRLVLSSPCERTRLPEMQPRQLVIPTEGQVAALHAAMEPKYRALVHLAAATGMRQGEVFGLTVDRVDFLRREVTVDRQLLQAKGEHPVFGPPKTRMSHRVIPVPQDLIDALAAHVAEHGTGPDGLLFTSAYFGPMKKTSFNSGPWAKAVEASGFPGGMHALRHYTASRLIHAGLSVKVVQSRLGHATAAESLDTYGHLWPTDEDRTREATAGAVAGAPSEAVRAEGGR